MLRILHLEDSHNDAELIKSALNAESWDCVIVHVKTREAFEFALGTEAFDVILSDYALPQYDGRASLEFARRICPEVPFVLISGTLGEEQAVDSLKLGATDYVLKQRLARLGPAIRRAVDEAKEREKLRDAERRVREQAALLDKARDAIYMRDLGGVIHYWNEGAERVYGWSSAEVIGKAADELFQTPAAPAAREHLLRKKEWMGELRRVRRDGAEIIVESRWTLVSDTNGIPTGTLIIDTDVTEKKKLEEQFLRAQRMESLGALAGGIAHDLNNILSPILMVTELVREELPPESKDLIDMVNSSAQRGAAMVKQILSFARGIRGEHSVFEINGVIGEILRLAQDTFPRGVTVESDFADEVLRIKGDATQVHQLLMNLLVNARDAMPNGGMIKVQSKSLILEGKKTVMRTEPVSGPYVLLKVSDTGEGIPAHLLPKIYEPFFTTKVAGKGTGLGLSTVLSIIKSHNGFVEVSSEQGKGTIFEVYLPAFGFGDVRNDIKNHAIAKGHGEHILLIEDDAAVLEIAREILSFFNYRVISAIRGSEGVALYEKHKHQISAVVTDLVMPNMDGRATLEAMRRINPKVKAICVSGFEITESAKKEFNACLPKPYDAERLLNTLRDVLDHGVERNN